MQRAGVGSPDVHLSWQSCFGQCRRGVNVLGREMKPGEAVHIVPKTVHRMTAITDCDIFEVSTPELDDVVRLRDRYGR